MTEKDRIILHEIADKLERHGPALWGWMPTELRRIAGPDTTERHLKSRDSLVRTDDNGVNHVYCQSCQQEHFVTSAAIEGATWKLPCGSIVNTQQQVVRY